MKTQTTNEAAANADRHTVGTGKTAELQNSMSAAVVDTSASALTLQRFQHMADNSPQTLQLKQQAEMMATSTSGASEPVEALANRTGMPSQLMAGIESLSRMDMSDIRVHRNSDKPAQFSALAYAQGNDIHLGPGQEEHLGHEAWHVVQQKQGRVQPTMQMAGTGVNADPGLETEADRMGEKAEGGPAQLVGNGKRQDPESISPVTDDTVVTTPVVQRVIEVVIDDVVSTDTQLNAQIRGRQASFQEMMWFNSTAEAVAYANGTAEGVGVWDGEWLNLAEQGTIVFGESHNDIREDFVKALNIRHRLVEGAAERNLHGVAETNIPAHANSAQRQYDGGVQGKALENYWLRSGQYMARFAAPTLAQLSVFADGVATLASTGVDPDDLWVKPLERPGQLLELIGTLKGVTLPEPAQDATPLQRQIITALGTAQYYAGRCEDFGLEKFSLLSEPGDRRQVYRYRVFMDNMKKDTGRARWLYKCFALLAEAVEELGTLQFRATASETEIDADAVRVLAAQQKRARGEEPGHFEVWSPRRETAMLANLRAALTQTPPPLLVTMGSEHAKNRKDEITGMDGVKHLVIGELAELVALRT